MPCPKTQQKIVNSSSIGSLTFGVLQDSAACWPGKFSVVSCDLGDRSIHSASDLLGCTTSDVFAQCFIEEAASRLLNTLCQTLGLLEDFVGNGNGSFHTKSI